MPKPAFALLSAVPEAMHLLLLLVSGVLGITMRKRIGRVSGILLTVGCAIGILNQVLIFAWYALGGYRLIGDGLDALQIGNLVLSLVTGTLWLVWTGSIILAVLLRRPAQEWPGGEWTAQPTSVPSAAHIRSES